MELWVLLAIAAAALQTLRFMLQKRLSMGTLSTGGATLARFFYAAPCIIALTLGYVWATGEMPRGFTLGFWAYAVVGGCAQILATWFVVALFNRRNFAVGITFKKTEVIQTALFGLILLGDRISGVGWVAILIGLLGVLILSASPEDTVSHGGNRNWRARLLHPAAALGLASGALFAISAVGYRAATLEILSTDPWLRSGVTLAIVTTCQALGMMIWLAWRESGEITRVWDARKTALWIGLTGMGGSLCWFTAFTLQNAAYVFAVGQIEVIFSILASVLFFRERINRREYQGIGLLSISILLLVVLR